MDVHDRLTARIYGIEREGAAVRLTSNDGARQLMDVLRVLDAAEIEPATIIVRDPSLDDVFLTLTGHHAEDQVEQAESEVPS